MSAMTLDEWMEKFRSRFGERELKYMTAHKAKIQLQLKDKETGEIQLHELSYQSKDAEQLVVIKGGETHE